ncbi:MAG TPA: ABC transporter substrate-binding protein, partial [Candidatus Binatia bacterium]|nr:ABC transporter substrate-binding protein [Candidatus Binatia bacterium]
MVEAGTIMKGIWIDCFDSNLQSALRNLKFAVLLSTILLALSFSVEAQELTKIHRVGFLAFGSPPTEPVPPSFPFLAFTRSLRDLGYVSGRNLTLEARWAAGNRERLPALAAELVQLKVDIIAASGVSAVRAAKTATESIPIVMAGSADPVGFELIKSLARPGGNVTGMSDSVGREIEGKRLELLKQSFPGISRVAVVIDSASRLE